MSPYRKQGRQPEQEWKPTWQGIRFILGYVYLNRPPFSRSWYIKLYWDMLWNVGLIVGWCRNPYFSRPRNWINDG